MLFMVATAGHNCVNLGTFEIWGELSGIITGGIGRFEWASGTWTLDFEAFLVGEIQTVFTGTMVGTVEIPD